MLQKSPDLLLCKHLNCQAFFVRLMRPISKCSLSHSYKLDDFFPSGDIAEYFGIKIAFYFTWLGHYTTALCIPALVGFLVWVSRVCRFWSRLVVCNIKSSGCFMNFKITRLAVLPVRPRRVLGGSRLRPLRLLQRHLVHPLPGMDSTQ